MLSNLKIAHKVYLLGVLQLGLILLIGVVALVQMAKLGTELFEIAEEDIPLAQKITKATEHQLEQAIYLERVFFKAALVTEGYLGARSELDKNIKKVSDYQKKVHTEVDDARDFAQAAIGLLHSDLAIAEYRKIVAGLNVVSSELTQLEALTSNVISSANAGEIEAVIAQSKNIEKLEDKIDAELIALLDEIQSFTQQSALTAEADEQFAIKLIAAIFTVSVIVSMMLPFLISRAIVQPINELEGRLKEVSGGDGDLRLRLSEHAKDETGNVARAFNKFISMLDKVIRNVSSQADDLGASAEVGLRVMETTDRKSVV